MVIFEVGGSKFLSYFFYIWDFFKCVCVYTLVCVWVHMHMYVHIFGGQRLTSGVVPQILSATYFMIVSLSQLGAHLFCLGWLACGSWGSACLQLFRGRMQACTTTPSIGFT